MRARSSPGNCGEHGQLHVLRQRGGDAVGIDRRVVEPFRLQEDLVPVAVAEPDDLVLDRGAVARARGYAIWPEYMGERWRLARMTRWVASVVRVMPQWICGLSMRSVRERERLRWLIARAASRGWPSRWCVPSSRGGVPVFSRPSSKPSPLERARQPDRWRFADPAGRDLPLADMDQAAQEGAGGQHHRAGARAGGRRSGSRDGAGDAGLIRRSTTRVVGLALDHAEVCSRADRLPASPGRRACGRPGRAGRAPPGPCAD